jgi:hypothetical protein
LVVTVGWGNFDVDVLTDWVWERCGVGKEREENSDGEDGELHCVCVGKRC